MKIKTNVACKLIVDLSQWLNVPALCTLFLLCCVFAPNTPAELRWQAVNENSDHSDIWAIWKARAKRAVAWPPQDWMSGKPIGYVTARIGYFIDKGWTTTVPCGALLSIPSPAPSIAFGNSMVAPVVTCKGKGKIEFVAVTFVPGSVRNSEVLRLDTTRFYSEIKPERLLIAYNDDSASVTIIHIPNQPHYPNDGTIDPRFVPDLIRAFVLAY